MSIPINRSVSGLILLASLVVAPNGRAATLTWDADGNFLNGATDGGGTWDVAGSTANWSTGVLDTSWSAGSGTSAVFGTGSGSGGGTVALNAAVTLSGAAALTFNGTGGYVIGNGGTAANTLTISGAANISANVDATIGAGLILSGAAATTKTGSGNLTLGGSTATNSANSLSVNGGTVTLATGGALTTSGALTVGGGTAAGALTIAGGSLTSSSTAGINALTIGNGSNGTLNLSSGSLSLTAAGAGTSFGNNGTVAWTQTGGTFASSGNSNNWWGNQVGGVTTVDISGGSATFGTGTTVLGTRANVNITVSGSGSLSFGGQTSMGYMNGYAAAGTTSSITVSGGGSFSNTGGDFITGQDGNVSSTFTQTGGTVNFGTRTVYAANGTGSASDFSLSGGTFTAGAFYQGTRGSSTLGVSGTAAVSIGTLSLGYPSVATAGTHAVNLTGGTLTLTNGVSYAAGIHTVNLNGGTLRAGSSTATFWNNNANVTATIGSSGFTFDSQTYNNTVSQVLGGTGGMTKIGTGTFTLTGANTYGGSTAVSAGTLQVNGTHNGGSANLAYVVGDGLGGTGKGTSGADTLGGSGTITTTGTLSIAANATAGNEGQFTAGTFGSIGQLNLAGSTVSLSGTYLADVNYAQITLGSGASETVSGATAGDLIAIAGNADLSGLVFKTNESNPGSLPAAGSHYAVRLLTVSGTLSGTQPTFELSAGALARGQSVVRWGSAYYLVPEPASFALLALGGLLLLRRPSPRRVRPMPASA